MFQILEITLLIADYMNMMGHLLPMTPKTTTIGRLHSRSTSRSRTLTSAPSTPRVDKTGRASGASTAASAAAETKRAQQQKRPQMDSGVA